MEGLVKQRSTCKGMLTRIENWFNVNKDITNNTQEFKVRDELLIKTFNSYNDIQQKIENIDSDQISDRDAMECKYFTILALFREKIDSLTSAPSTSTQQPILIHQHSNSVGVKLPDLNIPQFSGDLTQFKPFIEIFTTLIVNDPKLTEIQKLIYLKSSLKNEPFNLVSNLFLAPGNLNIALKTLHDRYDNETSIIFAHIKYILNIPPVGKCTASNLREFIVTIKQNIAALKNLNVPVDTWDLILVFILSEKLDFNTKRHYESETDPSKKPTLKQFLNCLENKCLRLERGNIPDLQASNIKRHEKTFHQIHTSNTYQNSDVPGYVKCLYCNLTNHKIYKCIKFNSLSHNDKTHFIKNNKLCFNCLGSKHMISECNSQGCSICQKRHHSILHIDTPRKNTSFPQSGQNSHQNANSHNPSYANSHSPSHANSNSPSYANAYLPAYSTQANVPKNYLPHSNNPQSTQNVSNNSKMPSASYSKVPDPQETSCSQTVLSALSKSGETLLATAVVTVYTARGEPLKIKAVLDSCSTISLITESLFKKLSYNPQMRQVFIDGINEVTTHATKTVDVTIHSNVNSDCRFDITCSIVDTITKKLPQVSLQRNTINIPKHVKLADPQFFIPSNIDMLLGADMFYKIVRGGVIKIEDSLLTLINTDLGYIIGGQIPSQASSNALICYNNSYDTIETPYETCCFLNTSKLNVAIEKFWKIEDIPSDVKILGPDEALAENIFSHTTKILENGHFQVNMPLKTPYEHHKLGDSFSIAEKRFFTLERKLHKDPKLFEGYKKFIDEYIALGHAHYVPLSLTNSLSERKYFIPHLCVVRESSATTKLRVVFDASAKTTSGVCLNDVTLKGHQVQPNLFDILCRFRLFKFVLTTDIQRMYRQIRVNPEQNFLQNILWRDSPSEPLKCIELLTVSYGTNFAPFVSTRVLNEIAYLKGCEFPLAADAILKQTYIDDILSGCDSYDNLKTLYHQLNDLLDPFGLHLHKWGSNSKELLQEVSQSTVSEYDINIDDAPSKVLGVKWKPNEDFLCISLPQVNFPGLVTKPTVLSVLSQCFDPIGFVNPIIVRGKILMQKLWMHKLDWDTEITNPVLLREWEEFFKNLPALAKLNIPRHLLSNKNVLYTEIHGFADASLAAYGACIFLRVLYEDQSVTCHLICSKSRVAPVKTVTLPKLELSAMVLLSQLVQKIVIIFENKINIKSVNLWSDSQIALYWIQSHASRWSVFVSNRVSQIQQLTSESKWRHIESNENPADFLSRGLISSEILDCSLWWHGPSFLRNPDTNLARFEIEIKDTNLEERKVHRVLCMTECFWSSFFSRFSSFTRMQRSLSFCLRFVNNSNKRSQRIDGTLTIAELRKALFLIVKKLQEMHFAKELLELNKNKVISNKAILQLSPFLDEDGLLRVGGRLAYSSLPFDQKHPFLLPSRNNVTTLMLINEHLKLGHAGPHSTLSNFKLRFWPLGGLKEMKSIIRKCLICFKMKAQSSQQIMSNLPNVRVQPSRPFSKVGVDFGGPFLVKPSSLRRAPLLKSYLSLFVCMSTKAVHLELVSELTTEAFLLTLKRFISRRGNPATIYSDNATNFLGSKNQLKELYDFFKREENITTLKTFLSTKEIEWRTIPPNSPHWGGIWEAAIKSAKHHLHRIVGESHFTFEEFSTILAQIEAILNSRPLFPMSSDPNDLKCLTPGHFLIGDNLTSFPEPDVADVPENRLSRWQKCVKVQQNFWKRWSKEYLNNLQNKPKWLTPYPNLKVNDLVLIKEDHTRPFEWHLAKVIEIFPGADNKVRVVKIKTDGGIYTRSISKLCPLPMNDVN